MIPSPPKISMSKNTGTKLFFLTIFLGITLSLFLHAQSVKGEKVNLDELLVQLSANYAIEPDITYTSDQNQDLKLDLYHNKTPGLHPVVIGIHGGGWVDGKKEQMQAFFWPYLALGFSAVNVEYGLAPKFLAPAAIEHCLCALNWVGANANKYNLDITKIVTTGFSAGGHLALTTAMIPQSAELKLSCGSEQTLKVAAVVNLFGPTDIVDLIDRSSIKTWLGNQDNRLEIAKLASPINYVRPSLPPILTIHGDADPVVPYSHGVRLHKALDQLGVPNQLFTLQGAGHGNFTLEQSMDAHRVTRNFLSKYNIIKPN